MPGALPDLFGFRYEEIRPRASRRGRIERFVILIWGENPTFDYYIRPRLGDTPALIVDISHRDSIRDTALRAGDYILICRYLNSGWARRIAAADELAGTGLFFDDDYVAFLGDRSVPLLYRLDVARRTVLPLRLAAAGIADILVSTDTLKERFFNAQAVILPPSADELPLAAPPRSDGGGLRIAFHAQLSHRGDHAFAAGIARGLADLGASIEFDVVGPASARRLWADVPAARFHEEIDWPDYRSRCERIGADILIAPMLDTPLNQARAPTKAIDAVRMGAAAVLPRSPAYEGLGDSAILVEGGRDGWLDALRSLISDRDAVRAKAARLRAEVARWQACAVLLSQVLR